MTLEQLIEACGDGFYELGRLGECGEFSWYTEYKTPDDDYNRFYGSTPTECVQKLYDYLKENNLLNNN